MNPEPTTLKEALNMAEHPVVTVGAPDEGICLIDLSHQISSLAIAMRKIAVAQGVLDKEDVPCR